VSHSVQAKAVPAPGQKKRGDLLKLLVAASMIGGASVLLFRYVREQRPPEELSYYYDLSEQKLYTAPRTLVPPVRGLNDPAEDAFRAVVISTSGNPRDKASFKIAYLEKYSPEFKEQVEAMQKAQAGDATAAPPPKTRIDRVAAQAHRFVRRLTDLEWHPLNSPEAERIMTEWQAASTNGRAPVVCVP